MSNDIDKAARSMLGSPQGIRIIKLLDKMNSVSESAAGQELINMLAGGGGDAVKAAAQAAQAGTRDRARVFLSSMLSTKEGAGLVAKVIEIAGA